MLLGALTTGACTNSVTFGGQRYAAADEGIAAANAACSSILGSLDPLETPVVSDLRLVRPTNPIVATNGIKSRGIPRDWMVNYLLQVSIIEIDCIRAAIEKRNIAGKVTRGFSSTGLHEDPAGGVPVVYLYLPNHDSALWFFASDTVPRTGLGWDPSIEDPALRYMDFLGIIERLVAL
jgi:hypothetical protein